MNKQKIIIPEGYELIKSNNNTYEIKKKEKIIPKTWEEFCVNCKIDEDKEVFIDEDSSIIPITKEYRSTIYDKNICTNREEAEAFLALMQLRQLRKAWVGKFIHTAEGYYSIYTSNCYIKIDKCYSMHMVLSFPSHETAIEFYRCFKDLIEKAKILL